MIKKVRFPKIFFGWWTAIAVGTVNLWCGGYYTYGFSALFVPISSELGISRTTASISGSIGRLEGGLEGPIIGWLVDRFGPRWVYFFTIFIAGLSLILMNFINSLWALILVWGVMLGTAHNMTAGPPRQKAVANWFVRRRGAAEGIASVFSGLSGVLGLAVVAWLLNAQGWRMACVWGGLIMWIVGFPLAWFFIKQHRPEYYGLLPDGATAKVETESSDQMIDQGLKYASEVGEIEFTLRQAMRTPAFWLLLVAASGGMLAIPAINMHIVPFLTDRGFDPLVAAGMGVMLNAIGLPARFVGGLIADRFGKGQLRFLAAASSLVSAIGISTFILNPNTATLYVWFVLYGIGHGFGMPLRMVMRARYFGRKALGSIQGISVMIMAPVGIAAPIYAGWIYDTTGSYTNAFTIIAVCFAVSAVLMCFVRPPKAPAQLTDVRKIF